MANSPMQMREEVLPADIEAVRRIVESTGFFSKEEADVAAELVEERLNKGIQSGYYFLFAEQDARVVGYSCFGPIACTLFSYDLYWIAVEDAFRGKGLGRNLLEASEKAIAKLGGRRIYVETSSREQYHPTRAFYLRCDYLEASVLEDFYAPGDSKVTYLKVL